MAARPTFAILAQPYRILHFDVVRLGKRGKIKVQLRRRAEPSYWIELWLPSGDVRRCLTFQPMAHAGLVAVDRMKIDIDENLKDELAQDLSSEKMQVRRDAIYVLGRLGIGTGTLEVLKKLADSDPVPALQVLARQAYANVCDRIQKKQGPTSPVAEEGAPDRLDVERFARWLSDPSPIHRLHAVLGAVAIKDPRMRDPLLAHLDSEEDDWVLASMVKAIGLCGDATHVVRIQRFLEVESRPRLVANTIEAIAMLDPACGSSLFFPFLDSNDTRVQASAAVAFFSRDRGVALDTLKKMAFSPQARSRGAAIHCLCRLDDPDAQDILMAMLANETHFHLAERITVHFSNHGDLRTGGKALRLSQLHARVPGSYAYRRIAAAIGERLGASEAQMKAAVAGPLPDLFLRSSPTCGLAASSIVPPSVRPYSRPRVRLGFRVPVAGVALVGMIAVLIVGLSGRTARIAKTDLVKSSITPEAVVKSSTPAAFTNSLVTWKGIVQWVHPSGRQLQLQCKAATVSATFKSALREVRSGDDVGVVGRIVGRTRFGMICLDGQSVVRP